MIVATVITKAFRIVKITPVKRLIFALAQHGPPMPTYVMAAYVPPVASLHM